MIRVFTTILLFASLITSVHSQDIYSVQDGPWEMASTWNLNRIPNSTDFVKVLHDINVTTTGIVVDSLEFSNENDESAGLFINIDGDFSITSRLNMFGYNYEKDTYLVLRNKANVTVGELFIERLEANKSLRSVGLFLRDDSKLTVLGDLNYEYNGAGCLETKVELAFRENAVITVKNDININVNSGNFFELGLYDNSSLICENKLNVNLYEAYSATFISKEFSTIDIWGQSFFNNNSVSNGKLDLILDGYIYFRSDLILASNVANSVLNLKLEGLDAEMHIDGNLEFYAQSDEDLFIDLFGGSHLFVKGNVEKPDGFGDLDMSPFAIWEYVGDGTQTILTSEPVGNDTFQFSNVKFNTTNSGGMVLAQDLVVSKSLDLGMGIMHSSNDAILIIGEDATITGASADSYVQGPIKKIGLTGTDPFTFPIGHNGRFAPMTIVGTGSRAAGAEFTASYMSCPPPWGEQRAVNLDQISDEDHWTLERSAADDINVFLHWEDAAAQGVNDLSSMVVAMYNPDTIAYPGFPAGWTSIGNGGTTGGTGSGVSGAVMNIGTCPPPWGITNFTLGSTSNSNALPVEMSSITAQRSAEVIHVNWTAVVLDRVDHFVVEKSTDGSTFENLETVNLVGNNNSFNVVDYNPKEGVNYYRIRQVDLDGMYALTQIVSEEYKLQSDLMAFPNPIEDEVTIKGSMLKSAERINIYDNAAKLIYSKSISENNSVLHFSNKDLKLMQTGIYYLECINGAESETLKLFKK